MLEHVPWGLLSIWKTMVNDRRPVAATIAAAIFWQDVGAGYQLLGTGHVYTCNQHLRDTLHCLSAEMRRIKTR